MDAEMSNILRAPFPAELVGKLPRVNCSSCVKAQDKVCPKHTKIKCAVCGSMISSEHIHLDFVGHADVTNRLLLADPNWTWAPLSSDENGFPRIGESPDGSQFIMWINLTVGGVTRPGIGSVSKDVNDVIKELISDAIRNAAMRFGVALNLWSKGEYLEDSVIAQHVEEVISQAGMLSVFENQMSEAAESDVSSNAAVDYETGETISSEPDAVIGAAEPLPEFRGDDEDAEWEAAGVVQAVATKESAVADHPAGGGVTVVAEKQIALMREIMAELGMAQEVRAQYVSKIVGRSVGSLQELTRQEGLAVVKQLLNDKQHLDGGIDESFIDF